MTNEEKLHMIEDVLELDENTLTPEMVLADIEEYDSYRWHGDHHRDD